MISAKQVGGIHPGSASFLGLQLLRVSWTNFRLPWVDLDWLIDISCQITELDLSANCLVTLPSVIPWGLMNLRRLNLSNNQLTELPGVQLSDEIICTRWVWPPHSLSSKQSKGKTLPQFAQQSRHDRLKTSLLGTGAMC